MYLEAPYVPPSATRTSPVAYGDSTLVNAATLKLFDKEVGKPGGNANTVNPSWQKTVGYSPQGDQWAALKGQIVSCDSSGTKYALGQAVYVGSDITSVTAGLQQNGAQWVVDLSLNAGAASSFETLTTSQYNSYYAGYQATAANLGGQAAPFGDGEGRADAAQRDFHRDVVAADDQEHAEGGSSHVRSRR